MKTSNKMTIALSLGSFIPLMGWINTYSGSCISLIFPFISVCVICVGVMELSVKKREGPFDRYAANFKRGGSVDFFRFSVGGK